jgi:hypothetical protein
MMFALGVFACGLVWLAFSVALVRRTRRVTERRLLAGIATRRAEFDAERDELRARHAVEMYRLEREVGRVLDMATAHRLEADLKERDVVSLRAELTAREEDFRDLDQRLAAERRNSQDLERRAAELGAALRAAQHALGLEARMRAVAEESLDAAAMIADRRRLALAALRTENDALRGRLGEAPGTPLPADLAGAPPAAISAPLPVAEETARPAPAAAAGATIVPLPTRARQLAAESPEQSAAVVAEATRDLQRIAASADRGPDGNTAQPPRMPVATVPSDNNIGELVALRMAPRAATPEEAPAEAPEGAETRFFEALAEIRALKRIGGQAGEYPALAAFVCS